MYHALSALISPFPLKKLSEELPEIRSKKATLVSFARKIGSYYLERYIQIRIFSARILK